MDVPIHVLLFCRFALAGLGRFTPLIPFFLDIYDIETFVCFLQKLDPSPTVIRFYDVEEPCESATLSDNRPHFIVKWSKSPSELFHALENDAQMNKMLFGFLYNEMYRIISLAAIAKKVDYDTTRYWEEKYKEQVWEKFNGKA